MTYKEYQKMMAHYGFIRCPLTEEEFNHAVAMGATDAALWGIGCDMAAGVELDRAIEVNKSR